MELSALYDRKCIPVPQMPKIWHMPKLLDAHLWMKYANIHATYEVALINGLA